MQLLTTPLSLATVIEKIITPALPPNLRTPPAVVELLGIGLQESRFKHRLQVGGPARGFWQFERGGGIKGVLTHPASKAAAASYAASANVEPTAAACYKAVAENDQLACQFARLLLLTDPAPLPAVGDQDAAWAYYLRNWRPGKPHPQTWPELYQRAVAAVQAQG